MSRKRRIFDIDMPPVDDIPTGKIPDAKLKARRGPMAAAINENAESLRNRAEAEAEIRAENDRLAHELVRLKKAGLVVDRIALDNIHTGHLVRDRQPGADPELEELKASIRDIGLSNPIRLEPRPDGGFALIQGMRRLTAFRALLEDTGEASYAAIPAAIAPAEAAPEVSYRRMVDENLIRKDISFAEMAMLAQAYARDPANDCADVDKAVAVLFKSASYPKRSYIRAFAGLLDMLDGALFHPAAMPRNLGVDLKRRLEAEPALIRDVRSKLADAPDRSADEELAILRVFISGAGEGAPADATLPTGKDPGAPATKQRKAKTTFEVRRDGAVARCAASSGRLELRYDMDFSRVDRKALEAAVQQLLDKISSETQ